MSREANEIMDRLLKEKPLLEIFPMDGKSISCPRCSLEFKTMLHPFCTHRDCPPREYGKRNP